MCSIGIGTYSSVVSSGNSDGTVVKLFSRQSTIPSAHRHGCGQLFVPPHSSGAFSVKPINRNQQQQKFALNSKFIASIYLR